ncbi:MAG: 16S rRNA (cytidine(1402)-2'-O)-methyltransferase [Alphaproteobacteria bacterium]|nr:16S rRNA (cytidine(1402)-2'-O)-methyltransferase [Alphaproteobacteria bacterium]
MVTEPRGAPGGSKPDSDLPPGLYLVATPIGNLGDITLRALETLRAADLIACEDTRTTSVLLAHYGIDRPTTAYHEHNAERARPRLIELLRQGGRVALVSDAGTPLISDPGYKLVAAALEAGIAVTTCPGPSAVIAALSLAGLPTDRFLMVGFLPPRAAARRTTLQSLKAIEATLIVLEAPHRLAESLADMATILGPRPAAVARELTKRFEEVRRAPLDALAAHYREAGAPKGEIVVVIGPPLEAAPALDDAAIDERLGTLLASHRVGEAAAVLAAETGLPRRMLYARALKLAVKAEE